MCSFDALVVFDLNRYVFFSDTFVVPDLCRCALSMHSLYLISMDVLVVFDHGYVDHVDETSAPPPPDAC